MPIVPFIMSTVKRSGTVPAVDAALHDVYHVPSMNASCSHLTSKATIYYTSRDSSDDVDDCIAHSSIEFFDVDSEQFTSSSWSLRLELLERWWTAEAISSVSTSQLLFGRGPARRRPRAPSSPPPSPDAAAVDVGASDSIAFQTTAGRLLDRMFCIDVGVVEVYTADVLTLGRGRDDSVRAERSKQRQGNVGDDELTDVTDDEGFGHPVDACV